jgi:hypothetical protein
MGNLILVAGHAVLRNTNDVFADSCWFLLDFQRGEAGCYVGHIQRGVELAALDPDALLIFTGGQSRIEAGAQSEAAGYWRVAERLEWFCHHSVRPRALTEEFARDSFENLLFGVCRFKEYTGGYPAQVTLVGWAFKQQRFDQHRAAIGWPRDRFVYVGANDPPELEQACDSEARARAAYAADPYSSGPDFQAKRDQRNPFRRQHGYLVTCPELEPLLQHRGPAPFDGRLPWAG